VIIRIGIVGKLGDWICNPVAGRRAEGRTGEALGGWSPGTLSHATGVVALARIYRQAAPRASGACCRLHALRNRSRFPSLVLTDAEPVQVPPPGLEPLIQLPVLARLRDYLLVPEPHRCRPPRLKVPTDPPVLEPREKQIVANPLRVCQPAVGSEIGLPERIPFSDNARTKSNSGRTDSDIGHQKRGSKKFPHTSKPRR
jgi:hypothetical protein